MMKHKQICRLEKKSVLGDNLSGVNPYRRFFTLIELLVVVAIIAILASMLLPALNRARESGKSLKCLSQIKQIATAQGMYRDDNREWVNPCYDATNTPRPYWYQQINKYMPNFKTRFYCPSMSINGILVFTYGQNQWTGRIWGVNSYEANNNYIRFTRIKRPANMVETGEAHRNGTFNYCNYFVAPGASYISTPHGTSQANLSFFDGHAVKMTYFPSTNTWSEPKSEPIRWYYWSN